MSAEQAAVLDEPQVLDEPEIVDEDFGADLSDEELGDLLVREITIDGMCGVY
jgi:mycofactocin precursor